MADRYGRTVKQALTDEIELSKQLGDYEGQWVAIRRSQVVASADTPEQLFALDLDDIDATFKVVSGPFIGGFLRA